MGIKGTDLIPDKVQAQNVGTTPKPNLQVDASMFGGESAKNLTNAGKSMMDISDQLFAYADKKAKAADLTNTLEINEGLGGIGFMVEEESKNKTLGGAKGFSDYINKKIDTEIQRIRKGREFNDPESAARADSKLKSMAMRFKAKADVHEIEQTRQYNGIMLSKQVEGIIAGDLVGFRIGRGWRWM